MSDFDSLNPHQRRAVETVKGRVLILAGAGSGKTRVLTMRMAHLIKNLRVNPKSILGLTFTNKAAAEMRQRLAGFIEPAQAKQTTLSTFHSFCMKILRKEIDKLGYTRQFSLYNEYDVQRLVRLIVRDILGHEGELPSIASTMTLITQAKNLGLKPENLNKDSPLWHDKFASEVYKRLIDSMRAYNAIDFDNLLLLTVELFEKHPEVLNAYQEHYQYIMIDEYQDTNPVQFRLAELLSQKHNNLCVVGDDDQSIYGWRGADIKNILQFQDATVVKLEQNYRSTNAILKAANAVICHNSSRHEKNLWSHCGEGEPIEIFHAPNEQDEVQAVLSRLIHLRQSFHLQWKDIALLYRSNILSRQFELGLLKHYWKDGNSWVQGIPYQVFGGLEFYERREVKDLFAYLRAIVNPKDQEALLRIVNHPRRGIGDTTLDTLTTYNRAQNIPLWDVLKSAHTHESINAKALHGIQDFVSIIESAQQKFSTGSLMETMTWLIDRIGYKKALMEEVKSQKMRDFSWENVEEFVSALAEYEQNAGEEKSLEDFITGFPLQSNSGGHHKKDFAANKVNLMTFHSAKGLEFKLCFLVGIEDLIIPHEKSMRETGIEEERRLMYVAMTRAMRYLVITMATQRMRMGKICQNKPSRFLFDIPKELLKVTLWNSTS